MVAWGDWKGGSSAAEPMPRPLNRAMKRKAAYDARRARRKLKIGGKRKPRSPIQLIQTGMAIIIGGDK